MSAPRKILPLKMLTDATIPGVQRGRAELPTFHKEWNRPRPSMPAPVVGFSVPPDAGR